MKATWLGHAAVLLEGSRTILIDPFLTGNPKAARRASDLRHVDVVIVTHDHEDHIGDAHEICRRTGAVFVGIHELAVKAAEAGVEKTEGMNIGGSITLAGGGGVKIHMTEAQHTSATGHVVGVVVEMDDGGPGAEPPDGRTGVASSSRGRSRKIYHAGDTGLFSDMKLIAEFLGPFDLVFLPIGDRYTMGPPSAAKAVEFLRPKVVVPIHHGTWPPITVDVGDFVRRVGHTARVEVLEPGGSVEI